MGGSQSTGGSSGTSDGTRNVVIETEDGEVDVKLTEDFISHVTKGNGHLEDNEVAVEDETTPSSPPRAEEILLPSFASSGGRGSFGEAEKWQKLYEKERLKNEEFRKINSEEFDKAANEVKKDLSNSNIGKLVPLCEVSRQEVLQCYHDNPDRTLLCSEVVIKYVNCVKQARKSLLVQTLNNKNSTKD